MKFASETRSYRQARNKLLLAERALRRKVEQVAALRLSELFTRGDTLAAYSFMYGPKMAKACPMCTSGRSGICSTSPPRGAARTGTRSFPTSSRQRNRRC